MTTTPLTLMTGTPAPAVPAAGTATRPAVQPADVAECFATLLARVSHGSAGATAEPIPIEADAASPDGAGAEVATEELARELDPEVQPTVPTAPETAPAAIAAAGVAVAPTTVDRPVGADGAMPPDVEVRPDDTATTAGPDQPHVARDADVVSTQGDEASGRPVGVTTPADADPTPAHREDTPRPVNSVPATTPSAETTPATSGMASEPAPDGPPEVAAHTSPLAGRVDDRPADHARPRAANPMPPAHPLGEDGGEVAPSGPRPPLLDPGSRAGEVASPTAIDRVLRAVEALENAPPPRRMTFDVDGVRIAVSLVGREVAVDLGVDRRVPEELVRVLQDRGFQLADGSGEHPGRGQGRAWGEPRRHGEPDGTWKRPDNRRASSPAVGPEPESAPDGLRL